MGRLADCGARQGCVRAAETGLSGRLEASLRREQSSTATAAARREGSDVMEDAGRRPTPSRGGVCSAPKKAQEPAKDVSKNGQRAKSSTGSEKRIPPIKAPVGNAPPPNVKQAKSKIGSLDNVTHKPKGGEKKVESVKLDWSAKSKIGSLDYATHKPGGGDKKILTQKLDFKNVQSRVGSKDNLKHKPGGGALKVSSEKLDFKTKATSKVGSLSNAKHKPGGGNVTILSEKLHFKEKAMSKFHSRSESEKGSSQGGSEQQSPVSSPVPVEGMPPLCEDTGAPEEEQAEAAPAEARQEEEGAC